MPAARLYLREWRKSGQLTLQAVARRLNTTNITVSRWERRVHPINVNQLELLADIFGCDVIDLFFDPRVRISIRSSGCQKV
ncbi:MAG: helix-turn-helix transcriptional regulator [Parvularculaceae bacterium]|nr:helix-turn-helix transcriptional regulator [Parvularculaceae bacterium]